MESANKNLMKAKESLSAKSEKLIDTVTDIKSTATEQTLEFRISASTNAKNLSNRIISRVRKKQNKEKIDRAEDISISTVEISRNDSEVDAKDIESAIKKLKGGDRVGHAGQVILTAGGASAGVAAAGVISSAAGASTLLGSTTLGSALGGVFVTATPVGWVVGSAIAGAATAYSISKFVRSGGRNDRLRQEISERLSKRLAKKRSTDQQCILFEQLQGSIAKAIHQGHLSNEQAARMIGLVEKGKLDVQIALNRVMSLSE